MKRRIRTRMLVDPKLQGALLCRTLLYWFLCVTAVLLLAGVQAIWSSQEVSTPLLVSRVALAGGPALIASLLVLPLVAFDSVRFSNKFTGPMHRLRRCASDLADGKAVDPVVFREGDYWEDLAVQFNRLASEISQLRAEKAQPQDGEPAEAGRC